MFTELQLYTRSDTKYRRGKDESARIPASKKLSYRKMSRQGTVISATNSGYEADSPIRYLGGAAG